MIEIMFAVLLGIALFAYAVQKNGRSRLNSPARRLVFSTRIITAAVGTIVAVAAANWDGEKLSSWKFSTIASLGVILATYLAGEWLVRRRLFASGIEIIEGPRGPLY